MRATPSRYLQALLCCAGARACCARAAALAQRAALGADARSFICFLAAACCLFTKQAQTAVALLIKRRAAARGQKAKPAAHIVIMRIVTIW